MSERRPRRERTAAPVQTPIEEVVPTAPVEPAAPAAPTPTGSNSVLENLFASAKVSAPDVGGDFEDLPDGDYEATVESVEYKNNKKGNPMITYTLKVLDGELAGRLHWKHVNLVHSKTNEFMPGIFRSEMDFIYSLLDYAVSDTSDINEFMNILDEIGEAAKSTSPIIVGMEITRRDMKNGGTWVNCKLT